MDFDIAARRLKKDQQSSLARSRASRNARTASTKAKREAALARQKAEKRLREKELEGERNAQITDRIARCVRRVERDMGVADVSPVPALTASGEEEERGSPFAKNPLASGWTFQATSIHGQGDKIALPPSVLETMTSNANDLDPWGSGRQRPIAFRIGILNPEYVFPSSNKMKALVENIKLDIISSEKRELSRHTSSVPEASNSEVSIDDDADANDEETNTEPNITEAYLEELAFKYLSYTHGTVVEFTQENECVGLPESIARVLLQPNNHSLVRDALVGRKGDIPVRKTVDPASTGDANGRLHDDSDEKSQTKDAMDFDKECDVSEKTPGHPAYGLFDVPSLPIEVTPVNSLPPGKGSTFTPTASSIENGFYTLKDVKLVLEQSLMRTRATLSRGDVIRTWRRGVSFDLTVSSLVPDDYGVVSCVNTDLNVDIGPPEGIADEMAAENAIRNNDAIPAKNKETNPWGGGRLLSQQPPQNKPKEYNAPPGYKWELPPEPEANVKVGICNIQIRGRTPAGNSAAGRRRFDVTKATMSDLFAFASQLCEGADPSTFRLVTRFPRRVFQVSTDGGEGEVLESAGICQGSEMFMVEAV